MSNLTATQESKVATFIERAIVWLKSRERAILLCGAAFQVIVLLAMIVGRAVPLLTGQTILLKVMPVDPRDMFRGEYVTLSYEISRIPPQGIDGLKSKTEPHNEWQGRTIYVSLVPNQSGPGWYADKYSIQKPASGIFIQGKVADWGRLEFGIESYFVQEGKGHYYEDALRSGKLFAEVSVTSTGQAVLKGLRVE